MPEVIEGCTIGIQATDPQYLVHVRCGCGNELFVDSKQKGWGIEFHGPVDFFCPCGKVISSPFLKKKVKNKTHGGLSGSHE